MFTRCTKRILPFLFLAAIAVSLLPNQVLAAEENDIPNTEVLVDEASAESALLVQVRGLAAAYVEKFGLRSDMSDLELVNLYFGLDGTMAQAAWEDYEAGYALAQGLSAAEAEILLAEENTQLAQRFYGLLQQLYGPVTMAASGKTHTPVDGVSVVAGGSVSSDALTDGKLTVVAQGTTSGSGCNKTENTGTATITLTNTSGADATVSFDWTIANGSITMGGSTIVPNPASVILPAENSVEIAVTTTGTGTSATATFTMSNFAIEAAKSTVALSLEYDSTLGSVTVNGEVVGGEPKEVALGSTTLAASPASGSTFLGWTDSAGGILSTAASYQFTPTGDVTVKAAFAKNTSAAWFKTGSYLFNDLNAANTQAASGDKKIILAADGTLPSGDYTISSGVTLLIPRDAANTVNKETPNRINNTEVTSIAAPTAYRTLTMADGASIAVNGSLNVAGSQYAGGTGSIAGGVHGPVGFIRMQTGSTITVNNGATLFAWGYIVGDGSVDVQGGGTVYENFQLTDWRGGNGTTDMLDNKQRVFPMSQYYVQNVEVPMTFRAGAVENCYMCTTITMAGVQGSAIPFIGTDGMFNITSGYIVKDYVEETDRLQIDAYGDISMKTMKLSMKLSFLGTQTIDTSKYALPINGNITLDMHSGNVTVTQDIAILPGCELIIRQGATCTLADEVSIYAYDLEDWGGYLGHDNQPYKRLPDGFAPGRTPQDLTRVLTDAKIQIDGTVMATNGYLYTTAAGAEITSTETGKLWAGDPGTQTVTYQAIQTGTDVSYDAIDITPAQLKNAAKETLAHDFGDTYRESVTIATADAYTYKDGLWHAPGCDGTFAESDTATCLAGGNKKYTCACGYAYKGEATPAKGHQWSAAPTAQGSKTCTTDGYDEYTCLREGCGVTEKRNVVPAPGHDYGADSFTYQWGPQWGSCTAEKRCTRDGCPLETVEGTVTSEITPATCVTQGKTVYTATFDDAVLKQQGKDVVIHEDPISALGHDYTSVVVTAPTCTEQGYTTYTCTRCAEGTDGHVVVDSLVDPVPHNYVSEVIAPTCSERGYTKYTCTNVANGVTCGDSYVDQNSYVAAKGHTEVVDAAKAPTCTETGLTEGKHCSVCGEIVLAQSEVQALGHSYKTPVVTAPTCTEKGFTTKECGTCGHTETYDEVAATGHSYTSVVTAPTCTEQGFTTHTCSKCAEGTEGHSYVDGETAALGHKWNAGETAVAATCTEDGQKLFRCTNTGCTETKTEPIAALGHSWSNVTYSWNEVEGGWSCTAQRICTRPTNEGTCGETESETVTDTAPVHTAPTCIATGSNVYTFDFQNDAFADQSKTVTLDMVAHTYQSVVTLPTCTTGGYTTYTCSVEGCNHTYTADEVQASGHNYVTVPGYAATCTTAGLTDGEQCTACQDWKTTQKTINSLGHDYGEWVVDTPAACETEGTRHRTCSVCAEGTEGHVETGTIPATNHAYKHTVVAPTCTADGYTLHECTNEGCGHSYQDTVVVTEGHKYTSVVTAPTCTKEGYTTHTCSVCGHSYQDTAVPMLEHVYPEANYVSNKDATCTADGTETAPCSYGCGETHTRTDVDSKLGHKFETYVSNNDATCTADGTKTAVCTRTDCGVEDTVTDEGTAKGHSYPADSYTYNNDATCEADGTKTASCANGCGETSTVTAAGTKRIHIFTDYVYNNDATCTGHGTETAVCDYDDCDKSHTRDRSSGALGHDYGEWIVETPATCVTAGSKYHTCTRETGEGTVCGYKETASIAATGHQYTAQVTPPTCTEKGYTTYTCQNTGCGHSYQADEVAAKDHSWGTPSYTWTAVDGGYTCTARMVCGNDENHVITEDAVVTVAVVDATCDSVGSRTYTAAFGAENGFATAPKIETIPATGHEYGGAVYSWNGFAGCAATRTCTHVNGGTPCGDQITVNGALSSARTAPTCAEDGYIVYTADFDEAAGYVDQTKTKTKADDASLAATNHAGTITAKAEKAASCEGTGLAAYWYCSACETYFSAFSETEKTVIGDAAAFALWSVDAENGGLIAATGHQHVTPMEQVDPTCTKEGLAAYWQCDCGAYLSAYTSATEYTRINVFADWKTISQENGGGLIPATGHSNATVPGTAATCTTTGLTDGVQCTECGVWATPQTPIDALGHSYTTTYEWTQEGDDWYCSAAKTCARDSAHNLSEKVKGEVESTVAAGCETKGSITYLAQFSANSGFDSQRKKVETDPIGHAYGNAAYEWGEGHVTMTATQTCANNASHKLVVTLTGSSISGVTTHATCTEDGFTVYTADFSEEQEAAGFADQEDTVTLTAPGMHLWNAGEVSVPATCTENGEMLHTCTRVLGDGTVCGDTKTETITAPGHSYTSVVTPPTCTAKGYTTYTCTRVVNGVTCGNTYTAEETPATGHMYGAWYIEEGKAATCTDNGEERRDCIVDGCDHYETNVLPATGHAWGDWYVEEGKAATCTENGEERRDCSVCDAYETKVIPAAHTMVYDNANVTKEPTCTETGLAAGAYCDVCGFIDTNVEQHVIPALDHLFTNYVYDENATCLTNGTETAECDRENCSEAHTRSRSSGALGHDYREVVTDPTCTADGYTTAVCQRDGCGYSYVVPGSNVSATGHDWGETVYSWDGNDSCTATRTCGHDAAHVETETAAAASTVTTAATCEENGVRTYTAAFKNAAFETKTKTETIDATGHSWGSVSFSWAADHSTCTSKRVCGNDASHQEVETVDAQVNETPATCVAAGQTVYTAVFENEAFAQRTVTITIDQLQHHYVAGEVTAPTCTAGGHTTYVCDQPDGQGGTCGDSYDGDYTSQLGHDYKHVVTQPTCTEAGYTTHTCQRDDCGYSYTSDPVNALDHSFTVFVSNGDATCTEDGTETATCDRCDETKTQTDVGSKKGHSFTNFVSNNDATCLANGTETATCDRCDETKTQTDADSRLDHVYTDWTQTAAPTCTDAGEEQRTCINGCNETQTRSVAALGHTLPQEWNETKAPTCYEAGEERRDCSECDYYETRGITKLQHSYSTEVIAPTCTDQGYTIYTCTQPDGEGGTCGYSYQADYVAANGHSWGEWYETTPATCTEPGVEHRDCKNCDATDMPRPINPVGHAYSAVPTAPTCTADGFITYTCTNCGDSYVTTNEGTALDHSFTNYVYDGNATCLGHGTETATCDRADCNETDTRDRTAGALGHAFTNYVYNGDATCLGHGTETATCDRADCNETDTRDRTAGALGHSFTNYVYNGDATCTENGTETATCDHDGCTEPDTRTKAGSKLGHSFTNYQSDGNATCTRDGTETAVCDRCTETNTRTEADSALGHEYGDWYEVNAASCTVNGLERRDCQRDTCEAYETRPVTAPGHSYDDVVTPPTCTVDGYTTHTCSACGDTYKDTPVTAPGHSYGTVVTPPTCTEAGYTTYTCSECGDTYTGNTVAAEGHNYTSVVTHPTCSDGGYTTHTCSVCTHSYVDAHTPANGHDAQHKGEVSATCTADGLLEYWFCDACDTYFSAFSEEEKTVIADFADWAGKTVDEFGGKLPALGHDYDMDGDGIADGVITKPTCTEDGYTTYTCQRDGCTYSYTDDEVSASGHNYTGVVTAPTCTADGYTTYTCQNTDCGHSYQADEVPATGHDMGEWYVVEGKAPTCSETGLERRDCSKCEHYETNVLAATGHAYSAVVTAPTCTAKGYTTHVCSKCSDTYTTDVTDALGHDYTSAVTAPTCTERGYTTYTCQTTDCGHTYVDPDSYVAATGHHHTGVVTAPTCIEQGYTTYTCSCGDTYTGNVVAASGHSYTSVVTAPTCTEDGYTTHTCSKCDENTEGHVVVDTVREATGHDYKDKVTKPTCTEDGYTTHTCSKCGDSYVDSETGKLGHTRTLIPAVIPTCTEPGSSIGFKCSTCGTILMQPNVLEATGHQYGVVVTAPTCTEGGYTTHTCSSCGDHYTDNHVDAIGHDYKTEVTIPTCTEGGHTTYTCQNTGCGHSYIGDEVPALEHDYLIVVTEPTCTTRGYTTYTCQREDCESSYVDENSYVAALKHSFTNYVSDNNATCTRNSTQTAVCDRDGCEVTDTVTVPDTALGHLFTQYVSDNNASCTANGTKTAVCDREGCGAVHTVEEEGTKRSHSFTNYVSDNNATCEKDGTKTAKCDHCTETETIIEADSALGHKFTDYKYNNNAACEKDGTKTAKCDRCDATDTIVAEGTAKGHSFFEYEPNNDATCEEDGTKTARCFYCDTISTITDTGSKKGHSFTNYIYLDNATCEQDGTKTAKCDRCDVTDTVTVEGSKKGHSFTNYVSDENATCEKDGTKTAKCDRCEVTDTITVEGSKKGHSFTNYVSDGNATCEADGTKTAKCDRCEVKDTIADVGSKKAHSFTSYVSDGNATCEADGTKTAKCDHCDAKDTIADVGSKKEHSYTNYVSDNNATCEKDGTKTAKCDNCDAKHTITDVGSKKPHSFTNYVSDGNATCEADGTKTAKCDHCDAKDTVADAGSKKAHSFTSYVSDGNATCEKDGTKTAKCDHCEAKDTIADVGSKKEHSYTNYVSDNNATCEKDGTKTAKCDHCDAKDTIADVGSKKGHSFTNYVSDGNATCTVDGTKTAKCDFCEVTNTVADEQSAKGHKYDAVVTPPTENKQGYTTHTCSVCQHSYVDSFVIYDPTMPQVIVGGASARRGETVTIAITAANMPKVKSLMIENIQYDSAALEFVSAELKLRGASIADWNPNEMIATYAFAQNTDINGVIMTLTFKVKENAEGACSVACSMVANQLQSDGSETPVSLATVSGTVVVVIYQRGDVNGDSFVNSDDAIYLLRYTLSANRYPINQSGDMNGDGYVNSDDAIYLLRYTLSPNRYPLH